MNTAKIIVPDEHITVSEHHHFTAVIVYEDYPTSLRAERVYHRLIKELTDEAEFRCLWVHTDSLSIPAVVRDATRTAAMADLVVFSTHAGNELPEHVRLWIEQWLPKKSLENSALAALVGLPGEQSGVPIHEYLRNVAERGKMDFMSQAVAKVDEMQTLAVLLLPQRWGINE